MGEALGLGESNVFAALNSGERDNTEIHGLLLLIVPVCRLRRLTRAITGHGQNVASRVSPEPQQGRGPVPGRAGGYPTAPPTDPHETDEAIRFLPHQPLD